MGIFGMNIIFRLRRCEVFFGREVGQDAMQWLVQRLCCLGVTWTLLFRGPPVRCGYVPGGFGEVR